ncbi:MAG: hypothetical protein LUD72_12275 [Bacteroidales bacterium]|nr:hypothetical protein [Bacteroidales bacterium]
MTKRILVVLLVVGMSLCFLPAAKAYGYAYGEKTNTVDIYVGYFGGPYAYIQTVTEDEMQNNCAYGEWTYSSIDNGYYTRYNLAYGVTMESLMSYCHITTSDISEIYFLGTDNNYYAGFHDLFGVPHYYFPYLAENYNHEYPDESNVSIINSNRIEVPAILAFEQSLYRDSGAFDYDKYKSMMDNDECLRIVFGQTQWNEVSTSDSVKWVYEIAVMLKGSPVTVENIKSEEYGSEVIVHVDSGFEELDELIKSSLDISSPNGRIEVIDNEDGTMTVRAVDSGPLTVIFNSPYAGDSWEVPSPQTVDLGDKPSEPNPDESEPGSGGDSGDTGGSELTPDDDDDYNDNKDDDKKDDSKNEEDKNADKNKDDKNNNEGLSTTDPGSGGGAGSGGNTTGSGGNANSGNGSGTGSAEQGNGSGGMLSTETGGTTGADNGSGDPTSTASGDASLNSSGVNADAQLVPMSAEGEAIYEQVQGYMMEQLEELDDMPTGAQVALLDEEVQQYIEDLIKQFEEEGEPLDEETILEMVRDYIDSLVDQLGTEELSADNAAESSEAAQSVYLSLGNVAGGDAVGGSTSGSGTTGGSGGKMLDMEEWPTSYTVILVVVLAALFVAGGTYRSLRFRRETAR